MANSRRREFLKAGFTAAASGITGSASRRTSANEWASRHFANQDTSRQAQEEYEGFSRFQPSRGVDPDSDFYCGKLVPGFRAIEDASVEMTAPDLQKLHSK